MGNSNVYMISKQTCTEMVFPMCSNGIDDMFEPEAWDYEAYRKSCYEQFKIYPRREWETINFGVSFVLHLQTSIEWRIMIFETNT